MGRIKQGLDYFPMSTTFMHDRLVRRVMKREGDSAFATLVEALSSIYAGKGYYVPADGEFYEEIADNLYNASADDVRRVIALSVECGLFDAGLFREHGILTSADIQRQYLFITKRRSGLLIDPAYCLLEEEELNSYRSSKGKGAADDSPHAGSPAVASGVPPRDAMDDVVDETHDDVTFTADSATLSVEMPTSGTQNKRKEIKTNQSKTNHLPNPPEGGDGGGKTFKSRKVVTQEDINALQPPADGVPRNFPGLMENLLSCKIPPSEQYAILLKSNFGAIGSPVWKGFMTIRCSSGKIKLPGRYLLSVIN